MFPSAKLIHDTTRQKQKSGKYPVKVRVIYLRKHRDYRTDLDLSAEEFEGANVLSPKKQYKDISARLSAINTKVETAISNIGVFTFEKFQNEFYGRVKDASDIFPFFEEYIATLKSDGQLKTATGYVTAMNSFKKYKPAIGFHDITVKWLKGFQSMLEGQGASETTVSIYLRKLRTIYNYAISIGVIKQGPEYPFGKRKYVMPAARNVKKALNLHEVRLIYNYPTIEFMAEDKARDFWMFSYMWFSKYKKTIPD